MILADTCGNKLVTPEHLLLAALGDEVVVRVLESSVLDLPLDGVKEQLRDYIDRQEHFGDDEEDKQMFASHQYGELMHLMEHDCEVKSRDAADVPELLGFMMQLHDSFAANSLKSLVNEDLGRFMRLLSHTYHPDALPDNDEVQDEEALYEMADAIAG